MSFFSGFNCDNIENCNYDRHYNSSISEIIGTLSNLNLAVATITGICGININPNKKINILVNIILFILSIILLVIYYIKKNEITQVFVVNADKNLNIIYFTSSIVIFFIYICIIA